MNRIFAFDSGASWGKSLTAERRDKFIAQARVVTDDRDYGDTLTVEGVRYVVGASALRTHTDEFSLVTPNVQGGYHGSAAQRAQLCYALQRQGCQGDFDKLVLSLPYGDAHNAKLCAQLTARQDYVWDDHKGVRHSVHFDRVHVMAQGVGALVVLEAQTRERPRTRLMADIGACTIDQVPMRYDDEKRHYVALPDKGRSRRSLSIMAFYRHWHDLLCEEDGLQDLRRGYFELMDLPMRGDFMLRYGAQVIDTQPTFAAAQRWFTQRLLSVLAEDLGPRLHAEVDQIVLTGGGAELVDLPGIQELDPRVIRLSVWSNVEGQMIQASGKPKDQALYAAVQSIHEVTL